MIEICEIDAVKDLKILQKIIQDSFLTVAKEFKLTNEVAPTNPAYISLEKLEESIESGIDFYIANDSGDKVGCVAIESDKQDRKNYFIERLAVIPEKRHNKIGRMLLDYALAEIKRRKGNSAGIAIINENETLKDWYLDFGFKETLLKNFDHLPFTVCFMKIDVDV